MGKFARCPTPITGRLSYERARDDLGIRAARRLAAIRLLLLTGCRKNEIVTLRWDDIDRTAREIRIRDAKTGARRIPLPEPLAVKLAGGPTVTSALFRPNAMILSPVLPG